MSVRNRNAMCSIKNWWYFCFRRTTTRLTPTANCSTSSPQTIASFSFTTYSGSPFTTRSEKIQVASIEIVSLTNLSYLLSPEHSNRLVCVARLDRSSSATLCPSLPPGGCTERVPSHADVFRPLAYHLPQTPSVIRNWITLKNTPIEKFHALPCKHVCGMRFECRYRSIKTSGGFKKCTFICQFGKTSLHVNLKRQGAVSCLRRWQ